MDPDLGKHRVRAVRAASRSLSEVLDRDPSAVELLALERPLPGEAAYGGIMREAVERGGFPELRAEKRRRLLEIAARDLTSEIELPRVGLALSDLADACLEVTLQAVEAPAGFSVIAMGKLGGRELNYSSDIDLMFLADPARSDALKAAERVLSALSEFGPEGQAFRVDMNLRPEGRNGALVRSLDGYLEYYRRWAKSWEYQALIKARAAAGDAALGTTFIEETRKLIYPEAMSAEEVENIRKMKERVEDHAQRSTRKARSDADDVKLGPGGIRDIEFSIQLLQLVHGGSDATVRSANTLDAIASLVDGGYIAEDDGAGLSVAYRWLRNVEHRAQLWQERQVHHLPPAEEDRARVARTMGFRDTPAESALERFDRAHRGVLADVRNRFERLFYRPMIETLADPSATRLSREALKDRLLVLGFRDVDRAARTLDGLVAGTSRRAKLFRVLTPALLRHLTNAPLPDEGLFGFLTLGEALESRVDVLGTFRDNPPGLEFLAKVLGSGRLLSDVLAHVPEEVALIADPRGPGEPKDRDRLMREAIASLGWRDPERRFDALRRFKRREMLRVSLADIGGVVDATAVGEGLTDLAEAVLEAALQDRSVPSFAVIAMGKLGGRELNYSSDIDVMFVHDGTAHEAETLAERLMRAIGEITPEGQAFRIDAGLRPEGKSGPLVRSLGSFAEYYDRWAKPWEHLALIKARAAAGDPEVGSRFIDMTRPRAFPGEVTQAALAEIRHLKARMERERVPRGTEPRRHIKMGPGGVADIEFAIQMIQMQQAHAHPELRVPGTIEALEAAAKLDLIPHDDARRLTEAYRFMSRLRNRLFFLVGRPVDALPTKPEDLEAVGIAMGYLSQPRQEIEEEYLRITRRARRIAEPLI
ncbi:MAG: bifunctional [glutamine synthetase] adenylyltransferase/[glutamine synthetase]-adenylyl-L-tyrosine phosphorylase, partial [Actinomycetota bacterium]